MLNIQQDLKTFFKIIGNEHKQKKIQHTRESEESFT